MMKVVGVFLLALALVVAGATSAQAGLTEAHQQALAVYKKTKDPTKAIKILEDAGIKGVLEQKPADMKRDAYVRLLNDYGFYLSEAADTSAGRGVAIDLLEKVIQLSPDRAVAYLNLGDVYVKEIDVNRDPNAKREMRDVALEYYQKYARLMEAKKLSSKIPARVQQFLARAAARDTRAYRYESVMDKGKEKGSDVCTHMLNLFNADLQKYREVHYQEHPEFASITWGPMRNLAPDLEDKSEQMWLGRFDINNDGHDDLVLKVQWGLHGELHETLTIYKASDSAPPLQPNFGVAELFHGDGEVGNFEANVYYLEGIQGRDKDHSLIAPLRLQPFRYQQRTYISMKDLAEKYETNLYEADLEYDKWLVVAQYKRAKELEDICYLRLISEHPQPVAGDRKRR